MSTPTAPARSGMIAALRSSLEGEVIEPSHQEYEAARRVWNGLIDRRPAAIARCAGTRDVVEAVRIARRYRPAVSIRGGGHQIAGSGVCDDGLVIDLSSMRAVEVDPASRTARAQGGATWGGVDGATQEHGLVTPGGEVSTTGIGGFTLGGGMGLLMRAYGLACDNLRSIEIVTADGVVRTAGEGENPELFWAARGGGRGIGVVTSFEFELHPLGPEVAAAQVFYPYENASEILREWPDFALSAPESVTPQLILWSVPPDPAIPVELHGRKTVIAAGVFAGPPEEADAALGPFHDFGTPILDLSGRARYVDIQSSVDALFPAGGRYYMKSHFTDVPSADLVETILEWDARRPTPESLVVLRTLGGAVGRVSGEETAFPHRQPPFNLSIDAGWSDPSLDGAGVGWARGMWDATAPYSSGVYVNFSGLGDEADDLRERVFGSSASRLAEVREAFDPEGLFAAAARRP